MKIPFKNPLRDLYSISTLYGGFFTLKYYYVNLYLGIPPIKQAYILDTGSSITTSPCHPYCTSCGNHINNYFSIKDPSSILSCEDDLCSSLSSYCNDNKQCSFSVSYKEGSSLSGIFTKELIRISDDFENDKGFILPIGCTTKETDLFLRQLANGVMGICNSQYSFVNLLYENKIIEHNLFSICLSQYGGYFAIGEINNTYHKSFNVVYIPLLDDYFYQVHIKMISINGINIDTSNIFNAIIDTGTTISCIPREYYLKIFDVFKLLSGKQEFTLSSSLVPCFAFASDEEIEKFIKVLPIISFELEGNYTFKWKPENYFYNGTMDNSSNLLMCLGFTETSKKRFTLGGTWMHGYDIIFDRENMRLGFVEADCDRGDKDNRGIENAGALRPHQEEEKCIQSKEIILMKKYIIVYIIIIIFLLLIIILLLCAIRKLKKGRPFCFLKIKTSNDYYEKQIEIEMNRGNKEQNINFI